VGTPEGRFEIRDAGEAYLISNVDQMAPFLMSVVSDSNHWMYLSSRGGLTAGRVDEATSLFPYETDDRLHAAYGVTGPLTVVRVLTDDGEAVLWRPFEPHRTDGGFERNLAKSVVGNWVEFEEIDHSLGLAFRCRWSMSDRFGFVRSVTLRRDPTAPVRAAHVLDGFLNVMPAGVPLGAQQTSSTLVDAYKRSQLDAATGLGLFTLEAQMSDRAEAAESLRANVVWWRGLRAPRVLLSDDQLDRFLQEGIVEEEHLTLGRRGAYLVAFDLDLREVDETRWELVADVGLSHGQVAELRASLRDKSDVGSLIAADVADATANLTAIIAGADGLQHTADHTASAHHAANVLFNTMRGGTFLHNHTVPADDFVAFVAARNRPVSAAHGELIAALAGETDIASLVESSAAAGDAGLRRLVYEYLPIFFSRRHGDPSRPWNRFAIRTKNDDGTRRLDYQGNWRDIFQNWEALTLSFPGFLESIIAKFVNASTVDGYNPYRITRGGIDWEVPEPDNPWSNIGYWGDHQIVYLLRLLETWEQYQPGVLGHWLERPIFVYANVPYRIASHEAMVVDPRNTITYDEDQATAIAAREEVLGADGRLVADPTGTLVHVGLLEKLLVPALAKVSAFVPGGGIWLNTQRPEWNDANNALAGPGLSMVTLYHLRRYMSFVGSLLDDVETEHVSLSESVAQWLADVLTALVDVSPESAGSDDHRRRQVVDALGRAGAAHRERTGSGSGFDDVEVSVSEVRRLCAVASEHLDQTIRSGRRDDGLYHAYNLVSFPTDETACVDHLGPMLEGQVAVLSSGTLDGSAAADLVEALFASEMYRGDQASFLLYPATPLRPFLSKNQLTDNAAATVRALMPLDATLRRLFDEDDAGHLHFRPELVNAVALDEHLERLEVDHPHRPVIHDIYEQVFSHHLFTGRSGSMYGYEGLGSIYWHMVAKLLLAVQEAYWSAVDGDEPDDVVERLAAAYRRIRAGLGFRKDPLTFGAIPTDCYSHTPMHAGAQQPGMTGQVKEEVLTRLGELGYRVVDGRVAMSPGLLPIDELFPPGADGPSEPAAFSVCAVPMTLAPGPEDSVTIVRPDGTSEQRAGSELTAAQSSELFARSGTIARIDWITAI
jgi:hypothetical protein